jgi:hypothetical protein
MWNGLSSCFSMLLVVSVGVAASTDPVGMLNPSESVYLNGIEVDHSNPVTPGDVIRTKERGTATVQIVRSIALIPPDSVVRLESGSLALDTGTISMRTGKGVEILIPGDMKINSDHSFVTIYARDFKISPGAADFTEFEVTRSNGLIAVTARKNAVLVSCGSRTLTLQEGNQISRADKPDCGSASERAPKVPVTPGNAP